MTVAHLTNTPLPDVWSKFTLGMICRTLARGQAIMPLLNPFAGSGEEQGAVTDPAAIRAMAAGLGIKRA